MDSLKKFTNKSSYSNNATLVDFAAMKLPHYSEDVLILKIYK